MPKCKCGTEYRAGSKDYLCKDCGHVFDEPVERDDDSAGGGRRGPAGRLADLDADVLGDPQEGDG